MTGKEVKASWPPFLFMNRQTRQHKEEKMAQAKEGDTVKVHCLGKLDNGKTFFTSAEQDPLQFTIGEGQTIPGFEQAVENSPGKRSSHPRKSDGCVRVECNPGRQPSFGGRRSDF